MKLKYHRNLTKERWAQFPFFQQILMIANELHRASKWIETGDFFEVKLCYERAFELLYLTVEVLQEKRKLRELLRFKEMLALLYIKKKPLLSENKGLEKVLILLDKESFAKLTR